MSKVFKKKKTFTYYYVGVIDLEPISYFIPANNNIKLNEQSIHRQEKPHLASPKMEGRFKSY